MEPSGKDLVQDSQTELRDYVAEEDKEVGLSTLNILDLPDSIIFRIFTYLPFSSVGAAAQTCMHLNRISSDELLWRHVFLQHYKLPASTVMPAKAKSWRLEFKRLYYHTPAVLSEEKKEHKDEVLHVSFSHDGTMFATCSKDGFFKVWECSHPVRLLFKMDMKLTFSWKFTQFSQFNETDTCLLVSGVYFGHLSTSGEIAVFNLQDDFRMQCRVTNKPYDVFGAWYDNDHLLSGTLYWTGDFNSVSAVWLSKASQEVESEVESVSMVLYRFENVNSSLIRLLHVAEVDKDSDTAESIIDRDESEVSESGRTSPHSNSLGVGSLDLDAASSGSEVKDKCQDQEDVPAMESCILDRLLQRYIAEDEFDLENEDKTDDDSEGADFHADSKASRENSQVEDALLDARPEKASLICEKMLLGRESSRGQIDVGDCGDSLEPFYKLKSLQAGGLQESGRCSEAWSSSRPQVSDEDMLSDPVHFSAARACHVEGGSLDLLQSDPTCGFTLPANQRSKLHTPLETGDSSNRCRHIASITEASNFSSAALSLVKNVIPPDTREHCSVSSSAATLDNPFLVPGSTTTAETNDPAQGFESVSSCSESSLVKPSEFPLLDFLAGTADFRIRKLDEGENRISELSPTSCEVNVDLTSESAMEVATEHDNSLGNILSADIIRVVTENVDVADEESESVDVADEESENVDGVLYVSDMDSDNRCEGASDSAITRVCAESVQDQFIADGGFAAASLPADASLNNASTSENRFGARDVSQQFRCSISSRNVSPINVPSVYDSNLTMLIPGSSHIYSSRNNGSATYDIKVSSITSNNNASNDVESNSCSECDTVNVDLLAKEASVSYSHKSSIGTQTEISPSRASSFHSLSHVSQSSSLSRDFRFSPPREKLLIYTWGSETYIPHKVGIKRMKWTDFTRGEVTTRRSSMLLPDVMENLHNMAGNRRDKPDVTIEMHGHIVGLSLSPDHKYLYVNCRPWPKNYIISDPQESPPLAQEVEISTIDLTTFNFVGPVLRSHKAYTHSDECFFLNLDVSDDYVASGAEDRQGYLWDRHYGIPLYRFPHRNVVSCVAINPQDPEILVTVSDDYTFKVWMSRCRASELTGSKEDSKGSSE